MGASYKAKARRHVRMAEKENLQTAMERAKAEMEKATTPVAFHAASAKYEELAGKLAAVKNKLKRKPKKKGFWGLW